MRTFVFFKGFVNDEPRSLITATTISNLDSETYISRNEALLDSWIPSPMVPITETTIEHGPFNYIKRIINYIKKQYNSVFNPLS